MTLQTLDFETGGTQGTSLTATSSSPSLNFVTPAGQHIYDTASAGHGTYGIKSTVGTTNTVTDYRYLCNNNLTQSFGVYFYFASLPPTANVNFISFRNSGGPFLRINAITSAGAINISTGDSTAVTGNPLSIATGLSATTLYYMSVRFTVASSTTGSVTVNLYTSTGTFISGNSSTTYNMGSTNCVGFDAGIISTNISGTTIGLDYFRIDDGQTSEYLVPFNTYNAAATLVAPVNLAATGLSGQLAATLSAPITLTAAAIKDTEAAAAVLHAPVTISPNLNQPHIRLAQITGFSKSFGAATLNAPVTMSASLKSAQTITAASVPLTAPITLTSTIGPRIRLAQITGFTGTVAATNLALPITLSGNLSTVEKAATALHAPVTLFAGIGPRIRLASIRGWSIQSTSVWTGNAWSTGPVTSLPYPVTLVAGTNLVQVFGAQLHAPLTLAGTLAGIGRILAANLTSPVTLGGSTGGSSGVGAAALTEPVTFTAASLGLRSAVFAVSMVAPIGLTGNPVALTNSGGQPDLKWWNEPRPADYHNGGENFVHDAPGVTVNPVYPANSPYKEGGESFNY